MEKTSEQNSRSHTAVPRDSKGVEFTKILARMQRKTTSADIIKIISPVVTPIVRHVYQFYQEDNRELEARITQKIDGRTESHVPESFYQTLEKTLIKMGIPSTHFECMDEIQNAYRHRELSHITTDVDQTGDVKTPPSVPDCKALLLPPKEHSWIEKVILGSHDYFIPKRSLGLRISFKHERPLDATERAELTKTKRWFTFTRQKQTTRYEVEKGFFIDMSKVRTGDQGGKITYEVELELARENSAKTFAEDERKPKREMYEIVAGEFIKHAMSLLGFDDTISIKEIQHG